ncbi:TauD/TfdA family dioxygenase [Streptomyces sp. NPDC054804]
MAGTAASTPHPVFDKPLIRFGKRILERTAPGTAPGEYRILGIQPLTPHIGAEITGVDLAQPIGADLADELRQALLEWKVIFFRDQRDFGPEDHAALAGLWGEPEANPFFPKGDRAGVSRLAKDAMAVGNENIWHSDHSFMAAPALGSVLRAVEIPASGGDTLWADMGAVYDNLPDATKERTEGLTAEHDWVPTWGATMTQDQIAALRQTGRYAAAVLRNYAEPTREHHADMRRALLASREARAAWQEAYDRARQEPVRPRGLTSREAQEAQEALKGFGRAAMLMESHVPRADSRFVPAAERFAEALETDTANAAVDVREHRNPDWGRVEEALHAWEDAAAGNRNPVVRREAELQKRALEDLATAVSRTPVERDVGSAREEQRVRAAVAAEGDGSGPAHRGG